MKNKRNLILFIIIILLITSFVAIYISNKYENSLDNSNKKEEILSESTYFTIQNAVNEYLNIYNPDEVYNLLNENYIREHNITKDNISTVINEYYNPSFKAKKILCKILNNKNYYYINGYIIDRQYGDYVEYESNVNYLVVVQNNKFVINPLNNNVNISTFFENHKEDDLMINNGKELTKINTTEKNKLISYIAEFKNLLYIDANRAYEMLSDNEKKYYNNINIFLNNIDNIYDRIDPMISNYTKSKDNDNYIYTIIDNNGNTLKIIEKSIMDYEIEF